MNSELFDLVRVATLTGLLWIPYVMDRLRMGPGLLHEVGYTEPPTTLSPWAARLKRAHANAVENLVVFAPLVVAAHLLGGSTPATAQAATVFFWSRLVHAGAYTFAVPWVRTIAFTVGWACQMVIAATLLTR